MNDIEGIKTSLTRINGALFVFALVLAQYAPTVSGGFEVPIIISFAFGHAGIGCLFNRRELVMLPISLVLAHISLRSAPAGNYAVGILTISVFFSGIAFIVLAVPAYLKRKLFGSDADKT